MKSFKIKYDARKASKKFKEKYNQFLKEDAWKDEAAETAIKNIKGQTRLGKYIKDNSKLPTLKKSTIKERQKFAEKNETGTSFNASKSNLTKSGQLLESLERTPSKSQVVIEPAKDRKPYTGQSKTPSNSELAKYLKDKGFNFLSYNEKLKKQIKTKLLKHIRRSLLKR